MATKCITITEDAYQRLAVRKKEKESFSDVIVRSFPRHSLMELAGILSKKEATELKKNIKCMREKMRKDVEKRISRLVG